MYTILSAITCDMLYSFKHASTSEVSERASKQRSYMYPQPVSVHVISTLSEQNSNYNEKPFGLGNRQMERLTEPIWFNR